MSVHPQAQAYLDIRYQTKFVLDDDNIAQIRAMSDERSRGTSLTQIASVKDIQIPGIAGAIAARVYNPKPSASGRSPALIYIHGGGWCLCSIETHDNLCRDLAHQADIVVISVEYRLAPEHKFPTGLEDCYSALDWVYSNADSLNVDPARLGIGGDSAGGNLSLATLILAEQRGKVPVAFQLLIYPSAAVMETESRKLFSNGYGLDAVSKGYFFNSYARDPKKDAKNPLISPLFAESLEYMPPTHIITAECDPLRDEGKLLAEKLDKDGVQCTYKCYAGMIHGFCSYQYQVPMDAAVEAVNDCAAQLRKHLCI